MMNLRRVVLFVFVALNLGLSAKAFAAPSQAELDNMIKNVDYQMAVPSDYRYLWLLTQRDSNGEEKTWQLVVFRGAKEGSLVVMANKPRTEAGKGFLRIGHNLWFFDPLSGKWERRGEDRSFFSKSSRRRDLDQWNLSSEYNVSFVADEKVGDVETSHVKLTLKPNLGWETDFPTWDLWLVKKTGLPVKADQYADSGKLMRSLFYPKWVAIKHPQSGKEIQVPQEIRIFDQVDKGIRTQIVLRDSAFDTIDTSTFTKGWVEAHSR